MVLLSLSLFETPRKKLKQLTELLPRRRLHRAQLGNMQAAREAGLACVVACLLRVDPLNASQTCILWCQRDLPQVDRLIPLDGSQQLLAVGAHCICVLAPMQPSRCSGCLISNRGATLHTWAV